MLKNSAFISFVTAILTIAIIQMSNTLMGTFTSLSAKIFFFLKKNNGFYISFFSFFSDFIAICLSFCTFYLIIKLFEKKKLMIHYFILILFFPIFLVMLVNQMIVETIYGNEVVIDSMGKVVTPNVNDIYFLVIQIVAYCCIIAVLLAYQKLTESFEMETKMAVLEQQSYAQKIYMDEAISRYEQMRSFRHDIKNHLLVLDGLMKNKETQKAREYLEKLGEITECFSFSCRTGNTIIDILLEEKFSMAERKGIKTDCIAKIPEGLINDVDLCIIFSNAIDNAMKACDTIKDTIPYISISTLKKGRFFLLEIENSCNYRNSYKKGSGIGLKNIETIVSNYHGAVNIEMGLDYYKLSILFIISHH